MRGIGQWASGLESWGPNWDPPRKRKKDGTAVAIDCITYYGARKNQDSEQKINFGLRIDFY